MLSLHGYSWSIAPEEESFSTPPEKSRLDREIGVATAAPGGPMWRSATGRSVRRVRGGILGIGFSMAGALLANGRCVAQVPAYARLTNPHQMAAATQTVQAGVFQLDSLSGLDSLRDYEVYIPPQCVSTRRCPLLVALPTIYMMEYLRPATDLYGIIVLKTADPTDRVNLLNYFQRGERNPELERLDVALKEVFRRFAIDPDKIALMGRCSSGGAASVWGRHNSDVFSRLIMNSTVSREPLHPIDPRNKTTELLFISGLQEDPAINGAAEAQLMRREGHPTKQVLGFRGHEHQWEDYYFVARWLQESWATPDPAARSAPSVAADPLPLLTTEALTRMTAFWTDFHGEPDAIRETARRAHLREVALPVGPVGDVPPSLGMVDMAALAAQYSSVATDLTRAGLTARQHDAYRVALASAQYVVAAQMVRADQVAPLAVQALAATIAANRVLGKNVEFMRAHPDELQALEATGMWSTP